MMNVYLAPPRAWDFVCVQKNTYVLFELGQVLLFSTAASNMIVYVTFNRRAATMFLAVMKVDRWIDR